MAWETLSYSAWRETCDTLHAHTQVLGKIAVTLSPPEPQLQHAALRLTARGWESVALPAGGGGAPRGGGRGGGARAPGGWASPPPPAGRARSTATGGRRACR